MSQKLLRILIVNVINMVEEDLNSTKDETKENYLSILEKIWN